MRKGLSKVAAPIETDEIHLGPLAKDLGFLIRRAQVAIFDNFLETLKPYDIRPAQYAVLILIETNPGLSQMAVSKTLNIERARLVHILDALEGRRWLVRAQAPTDRRSHALHLTPSGSAALKKIRNRVVVHESNVKAWAGIKRHRQLLNALIELGHSSPSLG